ncbi:MAG: GlxA family transcriptional regulator [Pseudomonadota bacterium]
MQKPDTPFRIGLWLLPGFAMMSHASAVEPLRAANLLAKRELYRVHHFGDGETVESSGAGRVTLTHPVGDLPPLDLFLVVAGGDPFAFDDPGALRWLGALAERVPRVGGVSGGSVVLARAGLMAGRRMTVHWEHAAALAERHPELIIERRLFVIDRDRVTCGGGTAPMDMMHALIAEQHGAAFARLVSDWFLHTDVRGAATPQRGLAASLDAQVPKPVRDAVQAMENHVADPLSLAQLGLMAGVSDRHLNRMFQAALGVSAMAFYRKLRLDVGRRLVTGSPMPLREIAETTGFASAAHFSNAYVAAFAERPAQARREVIR